jgi:hypothetical protein
MHITPIQASAFVTGTAILIGVFIVAFNLGRLDMAASARQCKPTHITYTIPFKGTLP